MVIPRNVRRDNPSLRWRTWAITQWVRYLLRVMAAGPVMSRAMSIGRQNIPERGGVIVLFAHPTTRDPHNIFKVFPRNVAFMAGEFLFEGARGWILRKLGHIKVQRGTTNAAEALNEAARIINAGGAVALAPEGTCTPKGMRLGPLKTGAARLARMTNAPVHLAIPFGTTTHRYRGWRRLYKKPPVTVVFTERLLPIEHFVGSAPEGKEVEAYTDYIRGVMLELLRQGPDALAERYARTGRLLNDGTAVSA